MGGFERTKKMEQRLTKHGYKNALKLESKTIAPKDTGNFFVYAPSLDKRYIMLEALKMQCEYLYSLGWSDQNMGIVVLRELVNAYDSTTHKNERKNKVNHLLQNTDAWLIALFNIFHIGENLQKHSIQTNFITGKSFSEIVTMPSNKAQWTGSYLFGKIAIWLPIMTIANLQRIFGADFVFLFPSSDAKTTFALRNFIRDR